MSSRRRILAAVALAAALSSTGCTLAGVIAAAQDRADPTREGHPLLDILAGVALDAVMVGTIVYVTKDWGPFTGAYSEGQ